MKNNVIIIVINIVLNPNHRDLQVILVILPADFIVTTIAPTIANNNIRPVIKSHGT